MTQENARRLHVLSRQLHEHLMSAALCAKEIGDVAQAQGNDGHNGSPRANGNAQSEPHAVARPLLDEATFSVIWRNKAICLGNTKEFRLLTYLARRANQYVTHLDLLEAVWDNQDKATATIRSVVRHLRRQLCAGGMKELAGRIRGHNGHYILDLDHDDLHCTPIAQKHRTDLHGPRAY